MMAMYDISDIALVTPLRDGMNLVAKEYLHPNAINRVYLFSARWRAAIELQDAIIIKPNDTDQIENAILQALKMPERRR